VLHAGWVATGISAQQLARPVHALETLASLDEEQAAATAAITTAETNKSRLISAMPC